MDTCDHSTADPSRLFCSDCGKLRAPDSLRKIRFTGFLGVQSVNPKMEQFWASGDPQVFDVP